MPPLNDDTVVAYTKMKQAALYFTYVVPIPSLQIEDATLIAHELNRNGEDWLAPVMSVLKSELPSGTDCDRLMPPHLKNDSKFVHLLTRVALWEGINSAVHALIDAFGPSVVGAKAELIALGKKHLGVNLLHERSLDVAYDALMDRYALDALPAVVPDEWTQMNAELDSQAELSGFRLALIDVNLIDTSTASWDQIMAIREDSESQKQLHRLRRFLSKSYEGKCQSFVEDDLHGRLDDHEAAARKFGFETKATVLEAVISSKWLQGSLTGAGIAALCGNNAAALVSGFTGVLFEVGNIAVKIARRNFEFKELIAQHPLGYIISANEHLGERTNTRASV